MCNLYNTALTVCLFITIAGKIIQIDSHDKLPPEMPPTTVSSPRLQNDEPEDAHVSRLQNDDPSLYSISTVSSLPSPIAHDRLSVNVEHQNSTVDSLTLEIEVQELTNRVTTLESGNSHLTDLYKSIATRKAGRDFVKAGFIGEELSTTSSSTTTTSTPTSFSPTSY